MLPLLLLLLPDPLTSPRTVAPPEPPARVAMDGLPGSRCGEPGLMRVERSPLQRNLLQTDLRYRRDGEVRRYLLLDRWERGCPAPISFALPGQSDGFIRELGRSAPVSPAPGRVQPPRSSE
jgi:hypothetical protein